MSLEVIQAAFGALGVLGRIVARSGAWRSAAWPDTGDPPFVNAVARLETALPPDALLLRLHRLEAGFGRRRDRLNAPRTLDLDLLDYAGRVLAPAAGGEGLILPHPRMMGRPFVLAPLLDVAPGWRHPVTGVSAARALAGLGSEDRRDLARISA